MKKLIYILILFPIVTIGQVYDVSTVGRANITDSTLSLENSVGSTIDLALDTSSFDSTHIDVMSMSIGGGDILATSDTANISPPPIDIDITSI